MGLFKKLILTMLLGGGLVYATPYQLDNSHTDVGFSVKHLMISKVKGKFLDFGSTIDFDSKMKSFNMFEAVVEAKSIDTSNTKRDEHLRSEDFFYAEKFPLITFKMKTYKANNDEGLMVGDLTIRGITKEVELKVEDLATIIDFKGNNRVGFTLMGKVDRMDFDLKWNKALEFGGVAVGNEIKIVIEVEAVEK